MLPDLIESALTQVKSFESVRAVALVESRAIDPESPEADDWDLEVYTATDGEPSEKVRRELWLSIPPFTRCRVCAAHASWVTCPTFTSRCPICAGCSCD